MNIIICCVPIKLISPKIILKDIQFVALDVQEEENAEQVEGDEKLTSAEEMAEEVDSALEESIYETELFDFEQEQEQKEELEEEYEQGQNLEELLFEETEEEKKTSYIDLQVQLILFDLERKLLWDDYKQYVDETVLVCLQNATLCRYIYIFIINI